MIDNQIDRSIAVACKFLLILGISILQACATPSERLNSSRAAGASEKIVEAEGQAVIEKGKKLWAKQQAVQDAIRQASLQAGAAVSSHTRMKQGLIQTDTIAMATTAHVSHTEIINEWTLEDIYHVRARVTLSTTDSCIPHYRKRIVATGFPLTEAAHLSSSESQDVQGGIPREIGNFLMESREFIAFNATQISLYAQPRLAPEFYDDEPYKVSKLMQLAATNGAQFVLSGVIRDLQIESGDYIQGTGPVGMLKSMVGDYWSRRGIGIDVYIHDGFTGALLSQYRYTDNVAGDVWLPSGYTVGSERFKATLTGAKISTMIAQASSDIRRSLACYPFSTRVSKIEKHKLFIDAGAQDNVSPGDQLVVYSDASEEFKVEGERHYLEHDKNPVGVITITDVRPRYAIGHFEEEVQSQGVRVGDWVRSW